MKLCSLPQYFLLPLFFKTLDKKILDSQLGSAEQLAVCSRKGGRGTLQGELFSFRGFCII